MDEREELSRLLRKRFRQEPYLGEGWAQGDYSNVVDEILAAGWRKLPEPGSAEWEAMVERARKAYFSEGNRTSFDAALRAALGLDQPHRENDERPEEQP